MAAQMHENQNAPQSLKPMKPVRVAVQMFIRQIQVQSDKSQAVVAGLSVFSVRGVGNHYGHCQFGLDIRIKKVSKDPAPTLKIP